MLLQSVPPNRLSLAALAGACEGESAPASSVGRVQLGGWPFQPLADERSMGTSTWN